jgi:hypothetical protein
MSVTAGTILKVVATIAWLDGNINQNVFYATITGGTDPYDEDDVVAEAKAWVAAMFANLVGYMSNECDGSQVQVYEYDSVDDDWDEVGTDSWTYNPTDTTDQMPRGVAGLVNARTTDPDVSGKKFLGGLCEDGFSDGLITSLVIAVIAAFADDWVTLFVGGTTGATWVPGVWSVARTIFYAFNGSYTTPTTAAYQRRRKRGIGA